MPLTKLSGPREIQDGSFEPIPKIMASNTHPPSLSICSLIRDISNTLYVPLNVSVAGEEQWTRLNMSALSACYCGSAVPTRYKATSHRRLLRTWTVARLTWDVLSVEKTHHILKTQYKKSSKISHYFWFCLLIEIIFWIYGIK